MAKSLKRKGKPVRRIRFSRQTLFVVEGINGLHREVESIRRGIHANTEMRREAMVSGESFALSMKNAIEKIAVLSGENALLRAVLKRRGIAEVE